jgi:hypothetical protein
VADWSRRTYPAPLGAAGVGSIPADPDAQNVPSFRRWRFEMKLSPLGLLRRPEESVDNDLGDGWLMHDHCVLSPLGRGFRVLGLLLRDLRHFERCLPSLVFFLSVHWLVGSLRALV